MADPMTPERLAEIRERAAHAYEYGGLASDIDQLAGVDVPALLAEVEQWRATFGESALRDGLARMSRVEAERDAARAEAERLRGELAETRALLDQARDAIADPETGYIPRLTRAKAEVRRLRIAWQSAKRGRKQARAELDDLAAQNAKTEDNFRDFAEDALAVQRERDRLAEQVRTLHALAAEALHLRQHGENAPGGTETWRDWDRKAPAILRDLDGTSA